MFKFVSCLDEDGFLKYPQYKDKWVVNLGCEYHMMSELVNCDRNKKLKEFIVSGSHRLDILLDFNYPLPFKSDSIDIVLAYRIIGHAKHPINFRKEIHRILKLNGEMWLVECNSDCKVRHGREYRTGVFKKGLH